VIARIIVRPEGAVSDDGLLEGQQRMSSDPLFKEPYSRLVDAIEVTEYAVSAETVRAMATDGVEQGLRKAALISYDTDLVWPTYSACTQKDVSATRTSSHEHRRSDAASKNSQLCASTRQ
jgi:hypothetical protein